MTSLIVSWFAPMCHAGELLQRHPPLRCHCGGGAGACSPSPYVRPSQKCRALCENWLQRDNTNFSRVNANWIVCSLFVYSCVLLHRHTSWESLLWKFGLHAKEKESQRQALDCSERCIMMTCLITAGAQKHDCTSVAFHDSPVTTVECIELIAAVRR